MTYWFQTLMRASFACFCKREIMNSTVTMDNIAGTLASGPFWPTSPEAFAVFNLIFEIVGLTLCSTVRSRDKWGLPGYAATATALCGCPHARRGAWLA